MGPIADARAGELYAAELLDGAAQAVNGRGATLAAQPRRQEAGPCRQEVPATGGSFQTKPSREWHESTPFRFRMLVGIRKRRRRSALTAGRRPLPSVWLLTRKTTGPSGLARALQGHEADVVASLA